MAARPQHRQHTCYSTYLALPTEGSTSKVKPRGEWRSTGTQECTPTTPDLVTVTTRSGSAGARKFRGWDRGCEMKATGSRSAVSCNKHRAKELREYCYWRLQS